MDRLRSTKPPWVELHILPRAAGPVPLPGLPPDFVVRTIDGRGCGTKAALLATFAGALAFPDHFGKNWDAFEDCLTDLDWLPATGYVIVVTHAHALLAGHEGEYATFVSILESAGRDWATPRAAGVPRPATPFHVRLTVGRRERGRRADWKIPVRVEKPA